MFMISLIYCSCVSCSVRAKSMARVPKTAIIICASYHIRDILVFPCGSHTSPGASAGVPAILPTDIIQVLLAAWRVFSIAHLTLYTHLDQVLYSNGWEQMEGSAVAVF